MYSTYDHPDANMYGYSGGTSYRYRILDPRTPTGLSMRAEALLRSAVHSTEDKRGAATCAIRVIGRWERTLHRYGPGTVARAREAGLALVREELGAVGNGERAEG